MGWGHERRRRRRWRREASRTTVHPFRVNAAPPSLPLCKSRESTVHNSNREEEEEKKLAKRGKQHTQTARDGEMERRE